MQIKRAVDIATATRGDSTILKKGYAAHPYKLADISEEKDSGLLELMLMSSSPGILDGDHYRIDITVGANSSLELKTQSYQRLFSMKQGASQQMNIRMEESACFCYLPHPVVPHAASNFVAKNHIFLTAGCRLTWGEIITCGRKLNGEEFLFHSYQNLTELYLGEQLVIRENLVMKPTKYPLQVIGMMEGYTHQASLIFVDEAMKLTEAIPAIHEWLSVQPGICAGISALPVNGVLIRLLGHKAEQLFLCLQYISSSFLTHQPSASLSLPKFSSYAAGH